MDGVSVVCYVYVVDMISSFILPLSWPSKARLTDSLTHSLKQSTCCLVQCCLPLGLLVTLKSKVRESYTTGILILRQVDLHFPT